MNWTTPSDLRKQILRLWERGKLLAALAGDGDAFPCRLALRAPSSSDLSGDFTAVRAWIEDLRKGEARGYRIVWREVNHPVIGRNAIPREVWVDSPDAALGWIGKREEAAVFTRLWDEARRRQPRLLGWLARHPLRALALEGDGRPERPSKRREGSRSEWSRLLDTVAWFQAHPRSGLYPRQIDIPGVHTKFIEGRRGVLAELLDLVLPPDAVGADAGGQAAGGLAGFCRRYGLRHKPQFVRFRILDPGLALFPAGNGGDFSAPAVFSPDSQDVTIPDGAFAALGFAGRHVFITENETNFLSFPPMGGSMVVFGAGYGFDALADARWLDGCRVYYWGDIDTHGFAILDQLRGLLPHAQSLLMDRETLLRHRAHWTTEPRPERRELGRLDAAERQLYDDLRSDRLGAGVRLEQERVGYSWVESALRRACETPVLPPSALSP